MGRLYIQMPDGKHRITTFSSKQSVSVDEHIVINNNGLKQYIPLTTLKRHDYCATLNINGVRLYPIDGNLYFHVVVNKDADHEYKRIVKLMDSDNSSDYVIVQYYSNSSASWIDYQTITNDNPWTYIYSPRVAVLNTYRFKYVGESGEYYSDSWREDAYSLDFEIPIY